MFIFPCIEAGWAPGPVWTGAENLTPTCIRSPDRPAGSQSLYRLSYPTHHLYIEHNTKCEPIAKIRDAQVAKLRSNDHV